MGEKFAANPVTGTGSMTVPIATSPGRSGFGPQLSLSYDSGAGNGPFGFGWSLSLPSITRKTDKGLPQYRDAEESDVFILSGAEDLVPVLVKDDSGGWARPEPEERERTVDGTDYDVHRYRPRIEGLFARIERWTNKADPEDTFWRSISKDNITTWYGKTAESRIFDPDDPSRVFSWLICESYDDKGNVIVYRYEEEDSQSIVISQAHERNRSDSTRKANRYLKRIRYGNHTPYLPELLETQPWPVPPGATAPDGSTDWYFEVVLDYGEHDSDVPTPRDTGVWTRRDDPFSSYRSGFEVRTYRLCQRVLMFHHFEHEEEVGNDCLVRSTDFTYSHEQNPDDARNPVYTFLLSATQSGYKREGDGYLKRSLPPVEFEYTQPVVQDTVEEVDPESLENLPAGLDGTTYRWTDLHGEGIPGILTEQGRGWFYKRNLSPISEVEDNGTGRTGAKFAPVELVAEKPNLSLNGGQAQFMDLAGDGQPDLVVMDGPTPGLYEHDGDEGWQPFRPFTSRLNRDSRNPNLRLVDLDGDGHADVLITEDDALVWHPSLAEEGFGPARRVYQALDKEKGPRLVFADGTDSIYLADLSGDGLTDLARIRNGEVCYWPNLGYGRFGARVTMDSAPHFDHPDQFDQRRVRLADIDGTGTTDIIYLHRDGVRLYFNQSGNSWSAARILNIFPRVDALVNIVPTDLLGNGTSCLVWSSSLPGDRRRPMRYVNLMGGRKPHLLVKSINNLGAETRVQYASSTKFYLQDKREGKAWITKLPFPVHVVEMVEQVDRISQTRYVTRYRYHHGYFDGEEREFRGFGMVEQWDTDAFAAFAERDPFPESVHGTEEEHHLSPVHTKTWFHTGAYAHRRHISRQFEEDYYDGDPEATLLRDTVLPDAGLTVEEIREACRALKGRMLRQEVYAEDGQDEAEDPYTVTEQNFGLKMLQPRRDNRHAVFFAHNREAISYHYERNPADPRISHAFTLEVDEASGEVTRSATVGYPRREGAAGRLLDEQRHTHIVYAEADFTNETDTGEFYLVGVPLERRRYEVAGREAPENSLFSFDEIDGLTAGAEPIAYEDAPDADTEQKRLIERTRTRYYSDDLLTPLPPEELTAPLLQYESYQAAFTPALLVGIYGEKIHEADLTAILRGREGDQGGYMFEDGLWWIPSGRRVFDPDQFYLPVRAITPFDDPDTPDEHFTISYDGYALLMTATQDQLGNVVQAENDYRLLQPSQITNPNGNRSRVAFDALGMVTGTAVMGKDGQEVGDSLEAFDPDLDKPEIRRHLDASDPREDAHELLGGATTRLVYDIWRYQDNADEAQPQPPVVWTLAREQHASELDEEETPTIQHALLYSDGLGREILTKTQAEPGPLLIWDPGTEEWREEWAGPDREPFVPRWVGTGRTVFNNKGKPVKKYEPFFSNTHRYQSEAEVVMQGVTPILRYDPPGRLVRTDNPDGSFSKVEFDPWQQTTWDENDTVLESDWYDDPDWDGRDLESLPSDPAGRAAALAAEHAETPTVVHLDTLGRLVLSVAHNREVRRNLAGEITEIREQKIPTRTVLDIQENALAIKDGRRIEEEADADPLTYEGGNTVMEYRLHREVEGGVKTIPGYDMAGRQLYQRSMDADERRILPNVAGDPIRAWDSRGHTLTTRYDILQRPTHRYVEPGEEEYAGSPTLYPERVPAPGYLADRTVYGDSEDTGLMLAERRAANLLGEGYKQYDGAGVVTNREFDIKGNLLESHRRVLADYRSQVNWDADPALEGEIFTTRTAYDALDRPVQVVTPHNEQTLPNVVQPAYNEANLLERVDVWLRRGSPPDGRLGSGTTDLHPVTNIDYDAKGQRTRMAYGNGAATTYMYDPRTFRLVRLYTRRGPDFTEDCGSGTPPSRFSAPEEPPEGEPCGLQNLQYTYDPVGNITSIRDKAQQTIFFDNTRVDTHCTYTYDALYRLIRARGREHAAQNNLQRDEKDFDPVVGIPFPNSPEALQRYTEEYAYDVVGNIEQMRHVGGNIQRWTRHYRYATDSNRLLETSGPGDNPEDARYSNSYGYNDHGSMTKMPHLPLMQWDSDEQLRASSRQVRDDGGTPETTYYVYDASGQRVRKVTDRQAGPGDQPKPKKERLYLDGFEIYREYNGTGEPALERETLHVMDDQQRIALVDTRTQGDDDSRRQSTRYQLSNHLGSACLELDEAAAVISYEEYHPYGTTAYQAGRTETEVGLKRYRYTGKERDDETGLNYHAARYYATWLDRWIGTDPGGLEGGINLYEYSFNNPLGFSDESGTVPVSLVLYRKFPGWEEIGESLVEAWNEFTSSWNNKLEEARRKTEEEFGPPPEPNAMNRVTDEIVRATPSVSGDLFFWMAGSVRTGKAATPQVGTTPSRSSATPSRLGQGAPRVRRAPSRGRGRASPSAGQRSSPSRSSQGRSSHRVPEKEVAVAATDEGAEAAARSKRAHKRRRRRGLFSAAEIISRLERHSIRQSRRVDKAIKSGNREYFENLDLSDDVIDILLDPEHPGWHMFRGQAIEEAFARAVRSDPQLSSMIIDARNLEGVIFPPGGRPDFGFRSGPLEGHIVDLTTVGQASTKAPKYHDRVIPIRTAPPR